MKAVLLKTTLLLFAIVLTGSCSDDSDEEPEVEVVLTVNDFLVGIDDNPSQGDVLGTVDATTTDGTLSYTLASQSSAGAVAINETTGVLTVADASLFTLDNPEITGQIDVENSFETKSISFTVLVFNIWTGSRITFTKEDRSDPTEEANQDRITDNVWITRGNEGGQIFNASVESNSSKGNSPEDTEWALGTTATIEILTFAPFRDVVRPQDVVGQDLVLHLITDDIYIDLRFTSWTQGNMNGGGFAYERSTQ